jgi:putative MFS transporter
MDTTAAASPDARHVIADLNARIDRLPRWGLTYGVFLVVGVSYFFAFYDISAISFTLPVLTKEFGLSGVWLALPVTMNLLGYMIGAYGLGSVADALGRRTALLITVTVLTIGGVLSALSWNGASLTIFRLIAGLGTGAELSIAATILTEMSPTRVRGRYLQINYLWGALGLAVTPFAAIALLTIPGIGWRFVFLAGALVAFVSIFLRGRFLPESPRWLVAKNRFEDAERLVQQMERTAEERSGQPLPLPAQVPAEEEIKGFPTLQLFRHPYLTRMVVTLAFWAFWYVTVYAYLGYEPTLIIKMGLSTPSGLLFSALGDIAIPVGAIVALLVVDLWQRKYLVALVAFIFTAALLVMAISTGAVILFVGAFFSSMMVAANSIAYVYTAEAFPTRVRATATSVGDGIGHVGGVVAPFIVIAALSPLGARGTFALLAAFVFVSGLVIVIGGIRTTGTALTKLAQ